jgi:hypothetical protein
MIVAGTAHEVVASELNVRSANEVVFAGGDAQSDSGSRGVPNRDGSATQEQPLTAVQSAYEEIVHEH